MTIVEQLSLFYHLKSLKVHYMFSTGNKEHQTIWSSRVIHFRENLICIHCSKWLGIVSIKESFLLLLENPRRTQPRTFFFSFKELNILGFSRLNAYKSIATFVLNFLKTTKQTTHLQSPWETYPSILERLSNNLHTPIPTNIPTTLNEANSSCRKRR